MRSTICAGSYQRELSLADAGLRLRVGLGIFPSPAVPPGARPPLIAVSNSDFGTNFHFGFTNNSFVNASFAVISRSRLLSVRGLGLS
jgi:hypothetical protein